MLLGTYKALPIHMPGQVLADLAVAIADGAVDQRSRRPADQPDLFGSVASTPTAWRVLDRVSGDLLAGIRQGRAVARATAWAAGVAPDLAGGAVIPVQTAGLELRHRQHARIEDPIRQAKAAGLQNLPRRDAASNPSLK